MVPALWGPDSFNNGAGMNRLIAAANFVHTNMPAGTDYLAPRLAPDDAWDVAAFMVSQPRPQKPGLDKDFPDLLSKPVDTPYGPYADSFAVRADPRNAGAAQGGNTGGPDAIPAGRPCRHALRLVPPVLNRLPYRDITGLGAARHRFFWPG